MASASSKLASASTYASTTDLNDTRRKSTDIFDIDKHVSAVGTPSAKTDACKKAVGPRNKSYVMKIRESDPLLSYRMKNKISDSWDLSDDTTTGAAFKDGGKIQFGRVISTGARVVRVIDTQKEDPDFDFSKESDDEGDSNRETIIPLKHPFIIGRTVSIFYTPITSCFVTILY